MKEYYQNNIVEFATLYLNKPYTWQSSGPDNFDASGFTAYVFKQLLKIDINKSGYGIDDTTKQMTNDIGTLKIYIEQDKNKKKYLDSIEKGDLVFFHTKSLDENKPTLFNQYPGHVGIYIGNNHFIHADPEEEKIIISELKDKWLNILVASRNLIS